jgi:flagellar protein FliO/FliZ
MTAMELIEIARIVFALVAVLGMIGVAAIAAKKLGLQNGAIAMQRARRLAIVKSLSLDAKRRLAIIACDGREHLVVLDAARVSVIERSIPARELAETAAEDSLVAPARKLHAPFPVIRLLQRAPRDQTVALRAAGII